MTGHDGLSDHAYYFDLDGNAIGMRQWGELWESDARFIGHTELPGGCWVSTVWLGIDHGFGTGPPVIFESMVFASREDMIDLDCVRYTTRAQAEAGHEILVTRWTGWTPGDPHPPEADASFLTQFINAISEGLSDRPVTPEEAARNDQMVVMYPKNLAPKDLVPMERNANADNENEE
jgi:hypothetical protein